MRTAEHVLAVINDRGKRGLPLEDVYRQLYNPALYLTAYGKIARNDGAMTKGVTTETVDGMSEEKIVGSSALLREEKYRWTPIRRVLIEKKHSTKKRPLGIPTWSDKLLQEVIRLILEAYFEPQFDPHSHGFRPARGCGTAISEIYHGWRGTAWFIEGDIKGCFDNIDHTVLLAILAETIHDNRFLRLVGELLKAGYLENWRYNKTLSGTPQGGIVSPILANIYLDRLDKYVTGTLIPQYTRGAKRKETPAYVRLSKHARRLVKRGEHVEARVHRKRYSKMPSKLTDDQHYRRLRYIRYADDFLLGFAGPREEAEEIKTLLRNFVRDALTLDLSEEKTLITHARTERARFLGYALSTTAKDHHHTNGQRSVNGGIFLEIPEEVISQKCARYMANERPIHRAELLNDDATTIVNRFQSEYRGLVNYYRPAHNLRKLGTLKWTMEQALTKTLASKFTISVSAVYRRFHATVPNDNGKTYKALRVVTERTGTRPLIATWGGISLARQMTSHLPDSPHQARWNGKSELVQRLQAASCELCGSDDRINVHHIRKLADLKKHGRTPPRWVEVMAARQRKTMILCHTCHHDLHAGRLDQGVMEKPGEPCGTDDLLVIWLQTVLKVGANDGKTTAASAATAVLRPFWAYLPYSRIRFTKRSSVPRLDYHSHPHLITNVATTAGPTADGAATPVIHAALQARDLLPQAHLVDTGFLDTDRALA
jgi:group II intron reverse transcriptase/maturase